MAILSASSSVLAQEATALLARHATLREQLENSPFGRPLVLESSQLGDTLRGEVHAVVRQPFAALSHALQGVDHWCDILILHLNVKRCQVNLTPGGPVISMAVGRKHEQAPQDAYPVELAYKVTGSAVDFLEIRLDAAQGPLGTSNYRILVQAVPLDTAHSVIRLSYSYEYGLMARIAMQAYLATLGRGKVGFSVVGRRADGAPIHVGDVRGAVERNTMRYYLAIEAYLGACQLPAVEQPLRRLQAWFDAVERYPRQLHEMNRDEYLAMKRREIARSAAPQGC